MGLEATTMAEAFREIRQRSPSPRTGRPPMSQVELAERLGNLTPSNISRVENPRVRQQPGRDVLERVAETFGALTSLEELLALRSSDPGGAPVPGESATPAAELLVALIDEVHHFAQVLGQRSEEGAARGARFVAAAGLALDRLGTSLPVAESARAAGLALVVDLWRFASGTVRETVPEAAVASLEERLADHPDRLVAARQTVRRIEPLLAGEGRGAEGRRWLVRAVYTAYLADEESARAPAT